MEICATLMMPQPSCFEVSTLYELVCYVCLVLRVCQCIHFSTFVILTVCMSVLELFSVESLNVYCIQHLKIEIRTL